MKERRKGGDTSPPFIIFVRYATKDECSSLLALLGEGSLLACKQRNEPEKSIGVSWIGRNIVALESFCEDWLIRVSVPLHLQDRDQAEHQLSEAALQDDGQFYFSVREAAGFALAEITAYGIPKDDRLGDTIRCMIEKLDRYLS